MSPMGKCRHGYMSHGHMSPNSKGCYYERSSKLLMENGWCDNLGTWSERIIFEIKFLISVQSIYRRLLNTTCRPSEAVMHDQWCHLDRDQWTITDILVSLPQGKSKVCWRKVTNCWIKLAHFLLSLLCNKMNFSENVWEAASLKVPEPARNAASVGGSQTTELRPIPAALPFSRHWASQVRSWLGKWPI